MSGQSAREAALAILSSVRDGAFFADALAAGLGALPERDRRLAHEIAAGVLRSRTTLDTTLKPLVKADWQRVQPDLKDILRIGAYQLLTLGRVPPHAAVATSVALARARLGARPAGLVNAVLRKVARVADSVPPAKEGESHPDWLVERWRKRFGAARARALVAHNDRKPPLVIQPVRWSAEVLAGALDRGGIGFGAMPDGGGFTVNQARVSELPGFAEGAFIVQDPAQARVLRFARFPRDTTIWDACAAPGGKSVILAQDHPVVASDVRRDRVERLRDSARRVVPGLPVFLADARQPPLAPGSLGAVLLDAPCSATGTLARHPDARWKLTPRRIAGLARLQAELLDSVAPLLRHRGVLVYATCSLEPEENEDQVNAFLSRHSGYRRTGDDLVIVPGEAGTDGAYAARMERVA